MAAQLESFEVFALDATPMLYRTAWLLTREKHSAEDLVQDTLARIYPRWRPGEPGAIHNPHGYARTTLVRLFLKTQKRKRAGEILFADPPERASAGDEDLLVRIALREELMRVSPLDRAILVLRYYADRSVADVSEELGLSEAAIRSRSSRAVGTLRDRLSPLVTITDHQATESRDAR